MPEAIQQTETLQQYLERRIKELNEADAEFCRTRWDDKRATPMDKMLAREESNKVTFARHELQEVQNVLQQQKDYKALFQNVLPYIELLVHYSQIHTVKGAVSAAEPIGHVDHETAYKFVQRFMWDHCQTFEGEYKLK